MNENAICKHCGKVIATVPKYYCPRSPNQTHEPVEASNEMAGMSEEAKAALQPKVETIDITPVGCQTPEGNARVNAAIKAFEDATAEVANLATNFFREHRDTLHDTIGGIIILKQYRDALHDDLRGINAAIKVRAAKQEEFLRAVAGAPPA